MSGKKRVAALISGRGSNLRALLEAQGALCPYEIVSVVSNVAEAPGLAHAAQYYVPATVIGHRGRSREAFEGELDAHLRASEADLVALAGFMRILTPGFVSAWAGRLINIHPSLLPSFPGLDTHGRALAAGVKLHGCTVHWVTEGVDMGPAIGQAAVPVLDEDTPDTLAARVLEAEHVLYPACLAMVCGGVPTEPGPIRWPLVNAFLQGPAASSS